jgi:hypothetical protein
MRKSNERPEGSRTSRGRFLRKIFVMISEDDGASGGISTEVLLLDLGEPTWASSPLTVWTAGLVDRDDIPKSAVPILLELWKKNG